MLYPRAPGSSACSLEPQQTGSMSPWDNESWLWRPARWAPQPALLAGRCLHPAAGMILVRQPSRRELRGRRAWPNLPSFLRLAELGVEPLRVTRV
jgi:hypothetical protein